jgi:MFS family permease
MTRRWIVLALVFAGIVINYIDRGNLSIAAPALMRDFRLAPETMGVLLSAFFWTYAAFQIPAGAIVDRIGIRRAYAVGFLIWSLASAAIALSRSAGDVIALRLVLGMAEALAPLASISFIRNNFAGEEQGLPTSIYIAGQNTGPAVGALVGSLLLARWGWRVMFAATGLGALVWLPGWLAAAPPDGTRAARQAARAADDLAAPRRWRWSMFLGNRAFWALSLAIWLSSYYWYFVLTWVPSYLILSRGFSVTGMGRVMSVALFIMAAVNVASGAVADRLAAHIGVFPARVAFAAAGWAGTAVVLLLLVVPGRTWALPILTVAMCSTGIGNSSFWAIAQHVPPRNMVGRTIGYLNTVSVAAGAVAPIVTGYILGPAKRFGPAVLIAGVCPAVAALCMLAAGAPGLGAMKARLAGEGGGA